MSRLAPQRNDGHHTKQSLTFVLVAAPSRELICSSLHKYPSQSSAAYQE